MQIEETEDRGKNSVQYVNSLCIFYGQFKNEVNGGGTDVFKELFRKVNWFVYDVSECFLIRVTSKWAFINARSDRCQRGDEMRCIYLYCIYAYLNPVRRT